MPCPEWLDAICVAFQVASAHDYIDFSERVWQAVLEHSYIGQQHEGGEDGRIVLIVPLEET